MKLKTLTILSLLIVISFALDFNITNTTGFEGEKLTAYNAIMDCEDILVEMEAKNFSMKFFDDNLVLAKYSFLSEDYKSAIEKTELIKQRKEKSLLMNDDLIALKERIDYYKTIDLNVTAVETNYKVAKEYFNKGDFTSTETIVANANAELDKIKSEAVISQSITEAKKKNIISFVQRNWIALLIGFIIALIIGIFIYAEVEYFINKKKLKMLHIEERVIDDLMKKAQYDHYQNNTIAKDTYQIMMNKYRERKVKINEEIPTITTKLKKGPLGALFVPKKNVEKNLKIIEKAKENKKVNKNEKK